MDGRKRGDSMKPNPAKKIAVDLSGDAPMWVSAATAAEMFVAAKEALEANGFSTEGLNRQGTQHMRCEAHGKPAMQESPLANVSSQEALRAQSIGVMYV